MNILLVDDDKLFIRKIIEGINWEEIGIHRVFSAEDMQQAIQILNTFTIDIMVTDIEMPRGNGLELLEWISENKYAIDTLVLSGYAHFVYVQKAMEYGCKRYLLKPVSNNELKVLLKEMIEKRRKTVPTGKKNFTKNWKEIVCNEKKNFIEEIKNKETLYVDSDYLCLVRFHMMLAEKMDETEKRLLMFVVQNIIMEFLDESSIDLEGINQETEEEWLLLIHISKQSDSIVPELSKIQNYLKETTKIYTCFYVSSAESINQVVADFENFENFCKQVVFQENGIVEYDDWKLSNRCIDNREIFDKFEKNIYNGEFELAKELIENCIETSIKEKTATKENFENITENITVITESFLRNNNLDISQIIEEDKFIAYYKEANTSVNRMYKFVECLIEVLEGTENLGSKKRQLVDMLKRYISEHIDEELSRKKLAGSIHFSEDYVARIFKLETGKTISDYVMEQRMEKAKKYLSQSEFSIGDVAMMVGYNNFSYFSKTFKAYTGKTPNEYRTVVKNTLF